MDAHEARHQNVAWFQVTVHYHFFVHVLFLSRAVSCAHTGKGEKTLEEREGQENRVSGERSRPERGRGWARSGVETPSRTQFRFHGIPPDVLCPKHRGGFWATKRDSGEGKKKRASQKKRAPENVSSAAVAFACVYVCVCMYVCVQVLM